FFLFILRLSSTSPLFPYTTLFRSGGFPTDGNYDGSVGADIRAQYDLSRTTSLTLTSGYTHLFLDEKDAGFVPVKLGVKYFLGNQDRKSTRLNSSHVKISYAVFCLK